MAHRDELQQILKELSNKREKASGEEKEVVTNEAVARIKAFINNTKVADVNEMSEEIAKQLVDQNANLQVMVAAPVSNDDAFAENIASRVKQKTTEKAMPIFIQALYGVLIGIGSLKFIGSIKELTFYNSLPDGNKMVGDSPGLVSAGELFFRLVFFVFTVLIVAHDWHTYYGSKRQEESATSSDDNKESFWWYIPQLGSLFFLGQMINAASVNEMFPWYFWGLLYTAFNVWHSSKIKVKDAGFLALTYLVHFCICFLAFFLLRNFINDLKRLWFWQGIILLMTIVVVVLLWWLRDKRKKTQTDENFPKDALGKVIKVIAILILVATFVGGLYLFFEYPPLSNRANNEPLKKTEFTSYSDSAFKKVDSLTRPLYHEVDSTEEYLLRVFDSLGRKSRGNGVRTVSPFLYDFFDKLGRQLDSLIMKQENSFAEQRKFSGDSFIEVKTEFDNLRQSYNALISESDQLAVRLQDAYLTQIDSTLSKIKTRLGDFKTRLQRKLEKKGVINTQDIQLLERRIDSLRRVFTDSRRYRKED